MKRFPSVLQLTVGLIAVPLSIGCTGNVGDPGIVPPGSGAGTGATNGGSASGGSSSNGSGSGSGNVGATGSGGKGAGAGAGSGGLNSSTGTGGGSSTATGGITGSTAGTGGNTVVADPNAAGVKPARLLSAREYVNTVRDLLGDTTMQVSALPQPDEDPDVVPSFAFHEPHAIATLDANLLKTAAETLARSAVSHLTTLLPCAAPPATSAEASCLSTFMTTFMPKVYRRPLTTTETAHFMTLYQTGRSTLALGFNDTIGVLLEAALQSPGFLYHWELDPGSAIKSGAVVQLGNYELANRLSYFLWGSMPDPTLMSAAAMGQLLDPANVETQVRRMLSDAKASDTFVDFFTDWLDINNLASAPKDANVYPMYNDALVTAMTSEVTSLVTGIMTGSGTRLFSDLITGSNSYANQALATLYGVTGVTGTALKPVTLNPAQRKGLLTTAGWLATTGDAAESNPPRRGKAIYTKFLCGLMPPPPAAVPPPADPSTGGTLRQRMETHDKNDCAKGCHGIIEPFGFAFEEYGGIGEYRTTDNNSPVDSTGSLVLDGQTRTYSNAPDLVTLLASSNQVQQCFTTQWLRYSLGRGETDADQASINAAMSKFMAANGDVRELIVGLTTSRTFRYRTPAPGEVLQ